MTLDNVEPFFLSTCSHSVRRRSSNVCDSHPAVFGFNLNNALNTKLLVSSDPTEFVDSIVKGATTSTS